MPDPFTITVGSGLTAAVNAAFIFTRFIYEIKNTSKDVKTCLDLVRRVDEDIQYTISLRAQHIKQLSRNPETLRRLDSIIKSACESILDVGRLLEGCRKEAHGGTVPIQGRVKWVLSDSVAFSRRTANLQQQHAAINIEIAYMRQLEALKPLSELANKNIFENPELLSMSLKRSSSRLSLFSAPDTPPPQYTGPVPRKSTMSDLTISDSASTYQPSSFEKQSSPPQSPTPQSSRLMGHHTFSPSVSEIGATPSPSIAFGEHVWQSVAEPTQSYVELEANVQPPSIPPKTFELESEPIHAAQNMMDPSGDFPRALVPGNWEHDVTASGRWSSSNISRDLEYSERGEEPMVKSHSPKHYPSFITPNSTEAGDWVHKHSISYQNENPYLARPKPTTSRELEASYPSEFQQSNASSSMLSKFTTSEVWDFSKTNQSQIWNGISNLELRSCSAPEVVSTASCSTSAQNTSVVSLNFCSSRQSDVSALETPRSTPAPVTSSISVSSFTQGSFYASYLETSRDRLEEEEDPETLFYRDLRMQEEEKQQRRTARMSMRRDNPYIP